MTRTPGTRVGAIFGGDQAAKIVKFLGYGVYQGEEIPGEDINPILNFGRPNPKILLDNGDVVWGMECWWGEEEKIKENLATYTEAGWTIEPVSIVEERSKVKEVE